MSVGVVTAWVAELGLITWRDFKNQRTVLGMPPPADYAATFVVFGGLLAIGSSSLEGASGFAAAAAWSLVLASVLNIVDPTFAASPGPQTTTTTSPPLQGQPV